MDMPDEMRRKYRYTHLWKPISKGTGAKGQVEPDQAES